MSEFCIEFQYKGNTLKLTEATESFCFICDNYNNRCAVLNDNNLDNNALNLVMEIREVLGQDTILFDYIKFCPSCRNQLLNNPEAYVASLSIGLYP